MEGDTQKKWGTSHHIATISTILTMLFGGHTVYYYRNAPESKPPEAVFTLTEKLEVLAKLRETRLDIIDIKIELRALRAAENDIDTIPKEIFCSESKSIFTSRGG